MCFVVFIIGIVGLFNVGKFIFFNVFIKNDVFVVNYLFVMIELNVGVVNLLDLCLDKLVEIFGSECIFFVVVLFVDIVGIVCGVSEGEGLGNKFFVNICEVDVIV